MRHAVPCPWLFRGLGLARPGPVDPQAASHCLRLHIHLDKLLLLLPPGRRRSERSVDGFLAARRTAAAAAAAAAAATATSGTSAAPAAETCGLSLETVLQEKTEHRGWAGGRGVVGMGGGGRGVGGEGGARVRVEGDVSRGGWGWRRRVEGVRGVRNAAIETKSQSEGRKESREKEREREGGGG